jgi:hypothetical protein
VTPSSRCSRPTWRSPWTRTRSSPASPTSGYTHETVVYTGTHTHSGPEELAGLAGRAARAGDPHRDKARTPAKAAWGSSVVRGVARNRSVEAHLANHGQDLTYGQGHADDDPAGETHTVDDVLRVLRVGPRRRPADVGLGRVPRAPDRLDPVQHALGQRDRRADAAAPHRADRRPGLRRPLRQRRVGDLQPTFDAWNPQALMDLQGLRLASGAYAAWRAAGDDLDADLPVDVRWTKACYCGQEVEPGKRVSDRPVFGLPFLGGSEDGASIFHEPLATEGRRLPAALAHPVHGRKVLAAPSEPLDVHDRVPELQVVQLGDRLMLNTPGEPSVEMARRLVAAVQDVLPAGVEEAFVVASRTATWAT